MKKQLQQENKNSKNKQTNKNKNNNKKQHHPKQNKHTQKATKKFTRSKNQYQTQPLYKPTKQVNNKHISVFTCHIPTARKFPEEYSLFNANSKHNFRASLR